MAKNNNKQIFVERETFEKNGKTFFSYFIKGMVRGKEIRIAVVPPDKGGYTVLDIVFGEQMAAELIGRVSTMPTTADTSMPIGRG